MNKPTKAIAALCLLQSANLYALGVGEIETYSALNQVLRAKIPLLSSKNEDPSNVRIGIASREVFKKSGIDRPHYLTEIKFTPVLAKNGEISVEVRSSSTIKEPFVNFILEIEWPQGRTLKEFTILLDPPVTMSDFTPSPVALPHKVKKNTLSTTLTPRVAITKKQQYGPTKSNDTIWGIAKSLAANNSAADHQRMMLALYDNNPKAFYKKNMNALKKGAILQAPSQQQLDSLSQAQVLSQYKEHNTQWSTSTAPSKLAQTNINEPTATPSGDKKKLDGQTKTGQLTLLSSSKQNSRGTAGKGLASDDTTHPANNTEAQASMALEMATTLEAENSEVKSRLSDLEGQVEKLQRLLTLKDQQLAQLQATKIEKAPVQKTPPVTTKPEPVDTASFIDTDDKLPLYAGGGLLIALLGLVLARRKKPAKIDKKQPSFTSNEAVDIATSSSLAEEQADDTASLDTSPTIITEEPLLSEFSPSEFNANKQTQEADPLTECDVYIAYGRYQQAQDIIESALNTDPNNQHYKLKLLDVHFASGDAAAFELLAESLSDIQQTDNNLWQNIAEMGAELCPESALFNTHTDAGQQSPSAPANVDNEQQLENTLDDSVEPELEQFDATQEPTESELSNENTPNEVGNEIEFSIPEANGGDEETTIELSDIAEPETESKPADEFEFNFDLIKNEGESDSTEPAFEESSIDFDDDFADDNAEDTKISLAQAYIEMEDNASARQSLEEVIQSGTDEQKQRAQDILDSL
ncbi:MAG: FimV/HubP family polar landmark protein [Cycloclasticus sp.]